MAVCPNQIVVKDWTYIVFFHLFIYFVLTWPSYSMYYKLANPVLYGSCYVLCDLVKFFKLWTVWRTIHINELFFHSNELWLQWLLKTHACRALGYRIWTISNMVYIRALIIKFKLYLSPIKLLLFSFTIKLLRMFAYI